jgi:hypothetical protein
VLNLWRKARGPVLALIGLVLFALLTAVAWRYRDDVAIVLRSVLALAGLLGVGSLMLSVMPTPMVAPPKLRYGRMRCRLPLALLALAGTLAAALVTFVLGFGAAYANTSGEAAYEYTGPIRSSAVDVWIWLVPACLVFAILFLWAPRLAAVGETAVVLAGYVAIAAVDEISPAVSSLLWSFVSFPLVLAVLLVIARERGRPRRQLLLPESRPAR